MWVVRIFVCFNYAHNCTLEEIRRMMQAQNPVDIVDVVNLFCGRLCSAAHHQIQVVNVLLNLNFWHPIQNQSDHLHCNH